MNRSFRIAEVALRVRDLEKASAFYQDVLGFSPHHQMPGILFLEVGVLESALGAAGHPQLLALFERGSELEPTHSTLDHIAFEIPDDAYDAEFDRFRKQGMVIHQRVWPDSLPWPGRAFFFRDPDGNVVELIAAHLPTTFS